MKFSTNGFWSRIDITIDDTHSNIQDIKECFLIIEKFEQKYSRFIKGNFLYTLNQTKNSPIDEEFFSLLTFAKKLWDISDGYFDITLWSILENNGYGILEQKIEENIWYKNIEITKEKVVLKNKISIDIWAIWKWYIVDKVYNLLLRKYKNFTINFGGDLRVSWEKKILLEDPLDEKKYLWEIIIQSSSLASSNARKRITQKWNHLVNPKNKNSSWEILTLFVQHKLCIFADWFSTLLYVTPLEKSLKILESIPGLEALIITKKGEIFKSQWFNCQLYTND